MGEVYKATDTRLDRTVAVKILPPSLAGDPQFRERFDREARVISQLDGSRFLAVSQAEIEPPRQIVVVQDWFSQLRRQVAR
jgi:serine/threonine protein kinase